MARTSFDLVSDIQDPASRVSRGIAWASESYRVFDKGFLGQSAMQRLAVRNWCRTGAQKTFRDWVTIYFWQDMSVVELSATTFNTFRLQDDAMFSAARRKAAVSALGAHVV